MKPNPSESNFGTFAKNLSRTGTVFPGSWRDTPDATTCSWWCSSLVFFNIFGPVNSCNATAEALWPRAWKILIKHPGTGYSLRWAELRTKWSQPRRNSWSQTISWRSLPQLRSNDLYMWSFFFLDRGSPCHVSLQSVQLRHLFVTSVRTTANRNMDRSSPTFQACNYLTSLLLFEGNSSKCLLAGPTLHFRASTWQAMAGDGVCGEMAV